jgi:hypothetical protein
VRKLDRAHVADAVFVNKPAESIPPTDAS